MPCNNNFIVGGPNAWFYFNQPITQIDGYDPAVPQVLMHGGNTGLVWKTVECASVVSCIALDSNTGQLTIYQKQLTIIHDAGMSYECPNIPLVVCDPPPPPSPTPTPTPN